MKVHGERKNVALIGLGASVIGSVVMYLFDPVVGRRRRAVARDKVLRLSRKSREGADTAARDFLNRARGFLAEARNVSERKDLPDSKLADRIRAKLGLMVSHPASIQVHAENGNVTLNGPILESEVDRLLARIASMPGVARVENRLEVHASPDSVPGLQGQPRGGSAQRLDLMQSRWSPATRLLVGIGASASLLYGAIRRGISGAGVAVLGLGALARAITNLESKHLIRMIGTRYERNGRRGNENERGLETGVQTKEPARGVEAQAH